MNDLLMQALLAMDSYNRGYNRRIKLPSKVGNKIGNATIIKQSEILADSSEVRNDFYAVAYEYSGRKIISYRGTDNPKSDFLKGWFQGIGFETPQSYLAAKFYRQLVGASNLYTSNAILTGHSLGGGLAGLIGGLYGQTATLFDNMAFEQSTINLHKRSNSFLLPKTAEALRRRYFNNQYPKPINFSKIQTHIVRGEVLDANRLKQKKTPTTAYNLYVDASDVGPVDRHSMSTLVMVLYAETANANWKYAAQDMWRLLYDKELATELLNDEENLFQGSPDEIVRNVLAYSVLDEGTLVFGDTGIKALFDDASDFGKVLKDENNTNPAIDQLKDFISRNYVTYAAKLALNKVEGSDEAKSGVLTLLPGDDAIGIDLSTERWKVGEEQVDVFEKLETLTPYYEASIQKILRTAAIQTWEQLWSYEVDLNRIDQFIVGANKNSVNTTVSQLDTSVNNLSFYYGSDGQDVVRLADEGNYLLYGDSGNDSFISNYAGDNFIIGGGSNSEVDTVSYEGIKIKLDQSQLSAAQRGKNLLFIEKPEYARKDVLHSIEQLKLGQAADKVVLSPQGLKTIKLDIDAGNRDPGSTNQDSDEDTLNLEAFSYGIKLQNNTLYRPRSDTALNPNLKFGNFEKFKYGTGDDTHSLSGSLTQFHDIDLGEGNDTILNAPYASSVTTGSGEDRVVVLDNILYLDLDENDRVFLPSRMNDPLTGGSKSAAIDNPFVQGRLGERYAFNEEDQLVIVNPLGHQIFINKPTRDPNDKTPNAGITLVEVDVEAYRLLSGDLPSNWLTTSIETAKTLYRSRTGKEYNPTNYDPLVLDLDGDGVELTPLVITQSSGGIRFDLDNDQFAEVTGWVSTDDGLLVWDKNSNGNIDDVNELFGIGLTSGFEELSALDSNSDGRFDSADAEYTTLRVWQDKNYNGVAEENELQTLAEADVQEISLNATQVTEDNTTENNGNQIAATSSYKRADNSQMAIADVRFELDQYNTTYLGDTSVSDAAAILPNAKGYGILPDLHVSMTQDAALLDVITNVLPSLNTNDVAALREQAMPIFATWGQIGVDITGETFGGNRQNIPLINLINDDGSLFITDYATQQADGSWAWASGRRVTDDERNHIRRPTYQQLLSTPLARRQKLSIITGEQLAFLERYFGQSINFNKPTNSIYNVTSGLREFLETMNERMELLAIRFAVQGGPLKKYFQHVAYDVQTDKFVPTSDRQLIPTFEAIFEDAPADSVEDYLEGWSEFIRIFIGNYDRQQEGAYNTYSFIAANLVAAYENVGLDIDFGIVATAFSIPEEMMITTATATNEGSYNPDIFYISAENNQQVRTYRGGNKSDAYIVGQDFGQIVIEDVESYASSAPDILRFAHLKDTDFTFYRDETDLILIQNGTDNRVLVKRHFEGEEGNGLSQGTGLAEITFADGTYLDKIAIAERTPKPSVTSDVILGTADINFYDGGAGFDTYVDTDEGDIYRFGLNDGHDIIKEAVNYVLTNSLDYVQFKPGITKDMLRFEQEYNSSNLHIYVEDTTDILTIVDQYDFETTVLFDDLAFHQVEIFAFENGATLTAADILHEAQRQQGDDKNNYMTGTRYHDYLDGGIGNDFLSGGEAGSDTYTFGRGYGFDYIHDQADPTLEYADTVVFAAGISPDDVVVDTVSASSLSLDFLISLKDDTSQLRIYNQLAFRTIGENLFYIERYQFQDEEETVWTRQDIIDRFDLSYERGETYNLIEGTSGNDTLEALPGSDKLIGRHGNDVYLYGLGDGQDIIENRQLIPEHDTLMFEAGIRPDDVELSLSAYSSDNYFNDLQITFKNNNSDSLTIIDYLTPLGAEVESIRFADGTSWDMDYVYSLVADVRQNDYVQGTTGDNTLLNSSADQYFDGNKGSDTYHFSFGDGHDVIYDNGWQEEASDRIVFGAGITPEGTVLREDNNDLLINFIGHNDWLTIENQLNPFYKSIEAFEFADGTTWSVDTEWFNGKSRNDGVDDIRDIIDNKNNSNPAATDDSLTIAPNKHILIDASQPLNNDTDAENNALAIMAVGEAVNGQVRLLENGNVRFTPDENYDGAASFRYNLHDAKGGVSESALVRLSIGGSGNAESTAIPARSASLTSAPEDKYSIFGTAGDDQLLGSDNDDQIWGDAGDDLIKGGLGSDVLTGGQGSDRFILAKGDGTDTITDFTAGTDFIGLETGLTFGTLTLEKEADDTLIRFDDEILTRVVGVETLSENSFTSA